MGENFTDTEENKESFALIMALRLCFATVFCVGLCGNLLVCIVVIQQRRMRTVMNCFTLNLAISDLIIIIIYVPSQYAAYENNQNWPFGNVGCRITYSIVPVCLSASIGTLLAISCERFRGIVLPFQPRLRLKTMRRIILVIWMASITTALPLMIIAGTVRKGNNTFCDELWSNPNSSSYYWISMFLLQYVIPLAVMSVLYGLAGWKLQKRSRFLVRNYGCRPGSINHTAEIARQRQSQNITKMLVALVLIYSFCMLPQHIVYFWSMYGNLKKWKYFLYVFRISNLFTMANSALNPIVYGTLQRDFRKAYRLFFRKYGFLCTEKEQENSTRQEKPCDKFAFRVKYDAKSSIKTPLGKEKLPMSQSENDGALETRQTSLKRRQSSDSHSPLISGESTSVSQSSKHSESNKEKNIHHGDKILQQNGEETKEIEGCNEDARDSSSGIDTGTTFANGFFRSKDSRSNQTFVNDSTNLNPESRLHKMKSEYKCLLDNAKETVL